MITDDILKARFRVGRRFVEEGDASFIVSLRTDAKLGRFLSPTDPDVERQKKWIECYKERERAGEEFYFIFIGDDDTRYGVSRIYNIDPKERIFEVGSWLFVPDSPVGLAVLADLCARDYAFDRLGFDYCRFEVRKENKSVVNYHKKFDPELIGEDELNFYFRLSKEKYIARRDQMLKIYGYDIK
jgi:RimJ/RimL family protein N-acetyltransferase